MVKFRDQVVCYLQRWFNAYQSGFSNESIEANEVRSRDLVLRFADVGNKIERMNYLYGIAEKHPLGWALDVIHIPSLEEIE